MDVKLHWEQCVKSNYNMYNRMEPFPIGELQPLNLCVVCRYGLPLLVAIWQENQQWALC